MNITRSETRQPRRRLGWRLLAAISGAAVIGSLMFVNVAVFAAAGPSVNLDQCRNGGLVTSGTQTFIQCSGGGSGNSGWVNGNAGASNAHYAEGESISYRARLTGLKNTDQVVLIMGYDVVHGGAHAIDFLTGIDRWQSPETSATTVPDLPCSNVSGCVDPTDQKLAPIPQPTKNAQVDTSKALASGCQTNGNGATQQPITSFNAIPAAERNMEFFDATPAASNAIQYVGPDPNLLDHNGDQEQQISVTFTANAANPVLAWGGHIARAADWGCSDGPNSASGISGSPYHMRIKNITVNGKAISLGNQDRSLSAAAVVVLQPSLGTTPSAAGPIGTVLNDTATLTAGASPTGSIVFNLYGPDDVGCVGTPVYTQTVALTGNSATTSPGYTTLAAGTYAWTASYAGDNNNLPASSGCTAEEVVIPKAAPTLPTTPTAAGPIGTILNDTATVTGGSNPTGSIVFNLYGPDDVGCVGTAVYNQTVALTGNSATTSPGYTTLAAGKYAWTASYAGDANNLAASSGCTAEEVTIGKNSPSAATVQNLIPNDRLNLTSATSNAGGHVDFYLFAPGVSCGIGNVANAAFTQLNVALVTNNHASTSNTGSGAGMYLATAEGTYHWLAVYSGDANNNAATSDCVETFSIDNNINTP